MLILHRFGIYLFVSVSAKFGHIMQVEIKRTVCINRVTRTAQLNSKEKEKDTLNTNNKEG